VGNVPRVVLFDEFLQRRRTFPIEVDDDEVDPTSVLLVQAYGAASLPLGIESALAEHENVVRFALDDTVFDVVGGDKGAVLAIAGVVESRIDSQVLGGVEQNGKRDEYCQQYKN
jgi:hypothetical protein